MSVRKGDRDEGDLQVIDASRILLDYTYDRVKDKNIFSKADRWPLAKEIFDCALQAWLANADRGDTFFQQKRMISYFQEKKGEIQDGKADEGRMAAQE